MTDIMRRRIARPFVLLTLAALLPLLAPGARAQDVPGISVRGVVLGPDNAPLPQQRVVLHRVDSSSGNTIAEAQTADDGTFVLTAPASADTSAVYFVASRYDGELYIGAPFREAEGGLNQVLQVGIPAMSATSMLEDASSGGPGFAPPIERPATTGGWMLLLIPLLGVVAVAAYALVPRARIPQERALYIRVAELDERLETAPPGQRDALLKERADAIAQLLPGS